MVPNSRPSSELPPPPAAALALSHRLAQRLGASIDAAGGWIGFDAWMQQALYEPGLGYYAAGSRKFGAAGDFVTAPELSPLFGACVAAQCAQWFEAGVPATLFEFGAGSGALAAQLLSTLQAEGALPSRYAIVELSADLRERQRERLAAEVPQLLDRVVWLEALPERLDGVVVGNELLDAMPVRLFRRSGGMVFERGVVRASQPDGGATERGGFTFADRPADADFARRVRALLADANADVGADSDADGTEGSISADYLSEVGEQAQGWVRTVGERIGHGALLLIDYGFPRAEFYHPQRDQGTLRCHYRHRSHGDPLRWPGLQDITAHVDFTAVAQAAAQAGLDLLGFTSQARFLIDCGLLERLMAQPRGDALAWARQTQAVQPLLSEAEMGELFKVIAFGRGVADDAIGFAGRDRRASLLPSQP
ncbi:MAG: class I SAM-dependent methyltransferase [Burkholderiaceae bacterium]